MLEMQILCKKRPNQHQLRSWNQEYVQKKGIKLHVLLYKADFYSSFYVYYTLKNIYECNQLYQSHFENQLNLLSLFLKETPTFNLLISSFTLKELISTSIVVLLFLFFFKYKLRKLRLKYTISFRKNLILTYFGSFLDFGFRARTFSDPHFWP